MTVSRDYFSGNNLAFLQFRRETRVRPQLASQHDLHNLCSEFGSNWLNQFEQTQTYILCLGDRSRPGSRVGS